MANDSLALPQRQAPAPVDTGGAQLINGGVTGEVSNPDLSISPVHGRAGGGLLDALVKVGGKLIQPAIKRQDDAAFFDGMARAAAGEAARDIEAESPAWATFFGEGAGTLGARAYEGARDASRIEGEALENLQQDRQVPPENYAQELRKRLDGLRSGDTIRDGQMQAAALQMLPGLMKVHAQAHVQWNQEQAFRARSEAFGSAVDTLEQWTAHARGLGAPVTLEDRERAGITFDTALSPIPGEDLRVRDKVLVATLLSAVSEGKFAAYDRLKDSGAFEALPVDQRDQLNNAYRVSSARVLPNRVSTGVRDDAAALYLDPPLDGAELDRRVNTINSNASITSGVFGADYIDADARLMLRQRAGNRERQAAEAAARLQATAMDAARKEAQLQGEARAALTDPRGNIGMASAWAANRGEGASRALEQQGTQLWAAAMGDLKTAPQARAQLLTNLGPKNALEVARVEFKTAAEQEDWNPQMAASWATVKDLPPEVMGAYVSDDQAFVFQQQDLFRQGGLEPQEAWKQARAALRLRPFKAPDLSKAEREAVDGAVKSWNTSPWLRDNTDEVGSAMVHGAVGAAMRAAPGFTPEARAMAAIGRVKSLGFENIGRTIFYRNGKGMEDWRNTLQGGNGAGEEQTAVAFQQVLDEKLKLNPKLKDQTTLFLQKFKATLPGVLMNREANGDFYFSVLYSDPDADGLTGRMQTATIRKRDIEAKLKDAGAAIDTKRRTAAAIKAGENDPTQFDWPMGR